MTSVKRKKKLRYLLFWESEGKLVDNHRLKDATEKLFLYTLYSRLKQIKTLYIVLLYAK